MEKKRNMSPNLFNEGKRIELKVSSAETTLLQPLAESFSQGRGFLLPFPCRMGRDPGFTLCWLRNAGRLKFYCTHRVLLQGDVLLLVKQKPIVFGPDLVCLVITENQLQSRPLECCSEAALL